MALFLPTRNGRVRALITNLESWVLRSWAFTGEGSKQPARCIIYPISRRTAYPSGYRRQLEEVVRSTIDAASAAKVITEKTPLYLEDRIWRANVILSYAKRISGEEAMNLLSICAPGWRWAAGRQFCVHTPADSDIPSNSICKTEETLNEITRELKDRLIQEVLRKKMEVRK
jgi:hypothetical protein